MSKTTHTNLLVSVFIQSYNYEKYITEAIESVLNQSYKNFELIIIDDASDDQSPAIIENFGQKYPAKIKFINRTENWGLVRTYNEVIDYINGDLFVIMSSDDVLPPRALEQRVQYFLDHPDVDILGTDFEVMDHRGKVFEGDNKLAITPQFKRYFRIDFQDLYTPLLRGNFLQEGALTIRLQRVKKEEILDDEKCPNLSDWEGWLRLAKHYRWGYLAKSTFVYRWHGENLSAPGNPINTDELLIPQKIYILSKQLLEDQTPGRRWSICLSLFFYLVRLNLNTYLMRPVIRLYERFFQGKLSGVAPGSDTS
jgi:glycosyltransferase involved in cell wall biosynthesis